MSDLEEELYNAVSDNDCEKIIELLKRGASANALVHSGQTILGHAVKLGKFETITILLECEKYMPAEEPEMLAAGTFDDPSLDIDNYLKPTWFQWEPHKQNMVSENEASGSPNSLFHLETASGSTACSSDGNCGLALLSKPSIWELRLFRSLRKFSSHKRKCDINLADFYDRLPIHYAAELGDSEILELLLNAGCRVNVSDSKMLTPLHFSVENCHESVTEILLKAGSRVNCKTSDKSSALHLAASRGFASIIEKLLDFGAKIDILDASDRTPLFLAVSRSHKQVADFLIRRGAKINIQEIHGYTPLSEAVFQKDVEMVQLLLSAGAKVTASHHLLHFSVYHRCLSLSRLLLAAGINVNRHDDCGDSVLHIAIRNAHVEMVSLLVKHGADINVRNSVSGQSLIHEAVDGISEGNFAAFRVIMVALLEQGCNLNVESFTPGDTPLYRAILLDKFRFSEELIKYGSDVNLGNVYSCNHIDNLFLARRKNHFRTVRLLVFAGFYLWNTPWLEILPSSLPHSYPVNSIKGWLLHVKCNPLRLSQVIRVKLRRSLGRGGNLVHKINLLAIPERLKRFLLLEDMLWSPEDNNDVEADTSNANVLGAS